MSQEIQEDWPPLSKGALMGCMTTTEIHQILQHLKVLSHQDKWKYKDFSQMIRLQVYLMNATSRFEWYGVYRHDIGTALINIWKKVLIQEKDKDKYMHILLQQPDLGRVIEIIATKRPITQWDPRFTVFFTEFLEYKVPNSMIKSPLMAISQQMTSFLEEQAAKKIEDKEKESSYLLKKLMFSVTKYPYFKFLNPVVRAKLTAAFTDVSLAGSTTLPGGNMVASYVPAAMKLLLGRCHSMSTANRHKQSSQETKKTTRPKNSFPQLVTRDGKLFLTGLRNHVVKRPSSRKQIKKQSRPPSLPDVPEEREEEEELESATQPQKIIPIQEVMDLEADIEMKGSKDSKTERQSYQTQSTSQGSPAKKKRKNDFVCFQEGLEEGRNLHKNMYDSLKRVRKTRVVYQTE